MIDYGLSSVSWCCPNCGITTSALLNNKGMAKKMCSRCGSTVVMKPISRRHHRLEIYAPNDYIDDSSCY